MDELTTEAVVPRQRPTAGEIEERTAGALETDGRKTRGVIPYNVLSADMGGWREQISPTALRNTDISELRCVIDHKGVPLGRYPKTLDIEERADGLHWSLNPPKSRQDVIEAVERGDMQPGHGGWSSPKTHGTATPAPSKRSATCTTSRSAAPKHRPTRPRRSNYAPVN